MSIEETRQLGIEFERRVQTMIPEAEITGKLDTETIYSYLNQYQDKYIHDIYRNLDNIPAGSKLSAHVESILQSMLTTEDLTVTDNQKAQDNTIYDPNNIMVDTARSLTFTLSEDFYMYLRSVSKVTSTFSFKQGSGTTDEQIRILPNQLVSQNDVWKLIETPHNSLRILKYPAVVLNQKYGTNPSKPTITLIYDRYTTVVGLRIMYYKQPQHFDIMTSTLCELPIDAFEDLVSGAVDLYVNYVAGAEARKRQMQEHQKLAQEKQNKNDKES